LTGKTLLKAGGFEIPFPQRTIRMVRGTEEMSMKSEQSSPGSNKA